MIYVWVRQRPSFILMGYACFKDFARVRRSRHTSFLIPCSPCNVFPLTKGFHKVNSTVRENYIALNPQKSEERLKFGTPISSLFMHSLRHMLLAPQDAILWPSLSASAMKLFAFSFLLFSFFFPIHFYQQGLLESNSFGLLPLKER